MTAIDYSRLRSLAVRRLVVGLERDGFFLARQAGSYRHFKHVDGRRVTVTFHHSSDTFRFKTLRSIEAQAQWTWEDLVRLELV